MSSSWAIACWVLVGILLLLIILLCQFGEIYFTYDPKEKTWSATGRGRSSAVDVEKVYSGKQGANGSGERSFMLEAPARSGDPEEESSNWIVLEQNNDEDEFRLGQDKLDRIGEGRSGSTFLGSLNGKPVVLKQFRFRGKEWMDEKIEELKLLTSMDPHPHVIKFLGIVKLNDSWHIDLADVFLVTEFCEAGDLRHYFSRSSIEFHNELEERQADVGTRKSKIASYYPIGYGPPMVHSVVSTSDLFRWAIQTASAMNHLATHRIIHGDLALDNVLLNQNKNIKVAGFDTARKEERTKYYGFPSDNTTVRWRHAAPEVFQLKGYSSRSDVWSFGVTVWEIFTFGQEPYAGLDFDSSFQDSLRNGVRPTKPAYATDEVYHIMQQCWNSDPEKRPSFSELEISLKEHYSTISETIEQKRTPVNSDYVNTVMGEFENSP